ncbi:MAG TPA: hypothetical protein VJ020_06920 [Anaerolineales bacterium]|nr:hypothetical protein [Anaerolineales bacterium]
MNIGIIFLITSAIALGGIFLHGAAETLAKPHLSEHEIEERVRRAIHDLMKAGVVGAILLVIGLVIFL